MAFLYNAACEYRIVQTINGIKYLRSRFKFPKFFQNKIFERKKD